jgi:ATP-dependent DNA helicase RecG
MNTREVAQDELTTLLQLDEDHFNDVKSKLIAPATLQRSFVAFANSDGGDLYIGIKDKKETGNRIDGFSTQEEANGIISTLLEETDPAVENVSIEFLKAPSAELILHVAIPKSTKVHYTASGDCYIRINASKRKIKGERITRLAYSKGTEPYERRALSELEISDITDSENLTSYMDRVNSHLEPELFLRKQRLLTKFEEQRVPNVGCALLFEDEPQAVLDTRCAIKIYRLRTTEAEYKREQLQEMPITINGPIEKVIRDAIDQVKTYIDGAAYQDGDKLINLEYPADALKEVLVNAVIHRDYSLNDDIHIRVFDNRIEVQSPGKLPGYMSIENLYEERFSRNPNVVRMLHNLPNPLNHDIGEGLDTARNELKKAGLIAPIFNERGNAFVVTIKHQRIASVEEVVLSYLNENPDGEVTNKLVRQLSGEDDMQKVKIALQRLRSNGEIEPVDPNASAFNFRYRKANSASA